LIDKAGLYTRTYKYDCTEWSWVDYAS